MDKLNIRGSKIATIGRSGHSESENNLLVQRQMLFQINKATQSCFSQQNLEDSQQSYVLSDL